MPNDYRTTLLEANAAARRVLLKHFGRLRQVELKGANDVVTIADREAEAAILRVLRRRHPGHAILAEESGGSGHNPEALWVIDPLDGTRNYSHAHPHFVTSIAFASQGRVEAGLVADHLREEIFLARRGQGATLNDRPIQVSPTARLNEALVVTEMPANRRQHTEHFLRPIRAAIARCQGLRMGGAMALDLAWIAAGRLDGLWQNMPQPWDMAAGRLLIEEAGGRVTRLNGHPLHIEDRQCLASNGSLHRALGRLVRQNWIPFAPQTEPEGQAQWHHAGK